MGAEITQLLSEQTFVTRELGASAAHRPLLAFDINLYFFNVQVFQVSGQEQCV